MEKYKFIGGDDVTFEHGKVYDKNYRPVYTKWTVGQLAHLLPNYWEKVEEFNYEYKWYDVKEVLPDERFDGKMVGTILYGNKNKVYGYLWCNQTEAFLWPERRDPTELIKYWCPLPDFPQ